jgi:hypothetical protein
LDINNYISSSCRIANGTGERDSTVVFTNDASLPADFLLSVYQNFQLSYPKFYKMDVLSKLGWLASEVLLMDSFDKAAYAPAEVGIVLSNANSSLDSDLRYMKSVADIASPALFVYTLPNIMIAEISIRNNFKGEGAFFIFEKFDAGFIETYVNNLFSNNNIKCCICGWVDVLGDDYKAVLFLVEKEQRENAALFSKNNMDSIFGGDK